MAQTTTNQTTKSIEQVAAILNISVQDAQIRKDIFLNNTKKQ
jgi:hypothetical protein